jgi:hypothetical protein
MEHNLRARATWSDGRIKATLRSRKMSPDELCNNFAQTGAKLTVKDLDDLVLIEGDLSALMFLGQVLIAQFCGDLESS